MVSFFVMFKLQPGLSENKQIYFMLIITGSLAKEQAELK